MLPSAPIVVVSSPDGTACPALVENALHRIVSVPWATVPSARYRMSCTMVFTGVIDGPAFAPVAPNRSAAHTKIKSRPDRRLKLPSARVFMLVPRHPFGSFLLRLAFPHNPSRTPPRCAHRPRQSPPHTAWSGSTAWPAPANVPSRTAPPAPSSARGGFPPHNG